MCNNNVLKKHETGNVNTVQIKNNFLFIILILLFGSIYRVNATELPQTLPVMPKTNDWIDIALAQKMMLDFRFYCDQTQRDTRAKSAADKQICQAPLTALNQELKHFIEESQIGGVILFSENIQDTLQVTELNKQLQLAASNSGLPLFIGIDQEGGRVARLPRAEYAAFSGNMAIGATYHSYKTHYANAVGQAIGQQLYDLGFNLNFAPNVDVNNNPNNPVINVRSFGDDSVVVGTLGQAMSEGMRSANILTTAKHFPGHGNTSIDSHSGLSAVRSPRQKLEKVELLPFRFLSETNAVDFIMSAHIQFPALDSSQLTSKSGLQITRPATLSRKIITDLLKKEYKFRGLVVSDALDMGAIAKHFTAEQALIETFNAGVDIALMPMVIDSPSQIKAFTRLLAKLKDKVLAGDINKQELWSSYQSILKTKAKLKSAIKHQFDGPVSKSAEIAIQDKNKALHQSLSDKSLTVLKGNGHLAIYRHKTKKNTDNRLYRLLAIMPDTGKCQAFSNAVSEAMVLKKSKNPQVKQVELTCLSESSLTDIESSANDSLEGILSQTEHTKSHKKNTNSKAKFSSHTVNFDGLVIGSIAPKQSPYEMVGVDQMERQQLRTKSSVQLAQRHKALFNLANAHGMQTIFISLRAPYETENFQSDADSVISTYNYNVYFQSNSHQSDTKGNSIKSNSIKGEAYESIAKQLFGLIKPSGRLPVRTISAGEKAGKS